MNAIFDLILLINC